MSTKLHNGFRLVLTEKFDILAWQAKLHTLRDELTAFGEEKLLQEFSTSVICALDRDTMGLFRDHPTESPIGAAYAAFRTVCESIEAGHREPAFDTGVDLCWRVTNPRTILVIVYTEMQELRKRVVEALDLEDFHYQNHTDPDDCTWEEMKARGAVWEAALDGWDNAPIARFHTFTLAESPKYPPPVLASNELPYHLSIDLDQRAQIIALDLLYGEAGDDTKGQDLFAKFYMVSREAREGGSLHPRFLELTKEVKGKLLPTPTWEDYQRKPPALAKETG